MSVITLTTDFGYKDPFVGEMKGVILSINPSVRFVDLTHGIEPHNIKEGAFVIGSGFKHFPSGSIHIAVVDPGVGSERRCIILEGGGHYFVGPDNGIFSHVISFLQDVKVISITNEKYVLSKDSPTFQGRDVFSPVAAWLSRGIAPEELGIVINDYKRFEIPLPKMDGNMILGEVVYIDRFGNAVSNIRKEHLYGFRGQFCAEIDGKVIQSVRNYSQAADDSLYCLINSSGYLELFVNMSSASMLFGIRNGKKVTVFKQI